MSVSQNMRRSEYSTYACVCIYVVVDSVRIFLVSNAVMQLRQQPACAAAS